MQEGNEHEDDEDEAEAPGAEEGAVADEDDQLWRRRIWNSPRMGEQRVAARGCRVMQL